MVIMSFRIQGVLSGSVWRHWWLCFKGPARITLPFESYSEV